jgi:hypothetical protein
LGFRETGLDLIENLKLNKVGILVTSRFEEENIQSRCQELELSLIPKSMAAFVPIVMDKNNA